MPESFRGDHRERQAENTISIKFGDRYIRVQNGLSIEEYMARIQRSTGEIHVVEAEECTEVLMQQKDSIVAFYTDGDIASEKDAYSLGTSEQRSEPEHSYVAWITTSFDRNKNAFKDKPFTYHLVTRDHTRDDVSALLDKMGSRMEIR
jgi:hypothetical protein